MRVRAAREALLQAVAEGARALLSSGSYKRADSIAAGAARQARHQAAGSRA
jgi:hypothetical protein